MTLDVSPDQTRIDGRLVWLWPDGTVLPVVAGGADDSGAGKGKGEGDGDGSGGAGSDQGEAAGDGAGATGNDNGDGQGDGDGAEARKVTMTQAELDRLIDKRMGRARKEWEREATEKAEREKMGEVERAKAEKADAEKAAAEKVSGANQRLVNAEAKIAALAAGVRADRLARFLRNVDLDDIEVNDDGQVDEDAVAKAVKAALEDVPEFKGGATNGNGNGKHGASGGDFSGGDGKPAQLSREQLKGMSPDEIVKAKKDGRLRDLLGQT